MVPKSRLYRPEFVNSTNIDFERSFISWEFINRNSASAQEGDQNLQMNNSINRRGTRGSSALDLSK